MYGGLHELNNRIGGLEDRFEELQLSLRALSPKPALGLEQLLAWLNPVFTDEEYENARDLRVTGTCRWILERPQFHDWVSSDATGSGMRIFWMHGPAGSGKTVLSANIVRYLCDKNPGRVACFFCVSDDEAKRQPFAIVRSWVAQMVRQRKEALEAAQEIYHGKEGRLATTSDVWQLFKNIGQRIPECYFVADGFDECQVSSNDDSVSFLKGLKSFMRIICFNKHLDQRCIGINIRD